MGKVICIMLAGGKGKRMGGKVSKQYLLMNDKPVLYYSLKAFEQYVDEIILVAAAGEEEYCKKEVVEKYNINKVSAVVTGGAERYLSVYEGLKRVSGNYDLQQENYKGSDDYVLIHDGARPFISKDAILRVIEKVKETKACIAAVPSILYWVVYGILSCFKLWDEPYKFSSNNKILDIIKIVLIPIIFIGISFILWNIK